MPLEVIASAVLIPVSAAVALWLVRTFIAPVSVKRFARRNGQSR